ncbi:MAG TPA: bifunctional oligoribonuclease/PAP phosphatase NrnA [Halanaerobiales bacterium]|nr:bifunctional oligoribonuclease/PAP phosphatase NrnA [Halanaerobiales bacterium]
MISLQEIEKIIKKRDNYLLLGHIEPDGDCIGSLFAFKWFLEGLNKKSMVLLKESPREKYFFLPITNDDYCLFEDFTFSDNTEYNFIALDCADHERMGEGKDLIGESFLINLDHHIDNNHFGDINYINPDAAATGEILYELFNISNCINDPRIDNGLATTLIADTGAFRYQNTSSRVFRMMASIMDNGVDIYKINNGLYGNYSYESVKLKGLVLSTLEISEDGLVSWLKVEQRVLNKAGADMKDTDGLVNYSRDIKGVEVGLAFFEVDESLTRVGFRSNNYCNVNEIAACFGGGGHPRAAGCRISLPLGKAVEAVLGKVYDYLDQVKNNDKKWNNQCN